MLNFWEVIVSNSLVVCALAIAIVLTSRVWRNPAALHTLWLLLLLKLFVPPLLVSELPIGLHQLNSPTGATTEFAVPETLPGAASAETVAVPSNRQTPKTPVGNATGESIAPLEDRQPISWTAIIGFVWLVGGVLTFAGYTFRISRFRGLLRGGTPAPEAIALQVAAIAARMGLARVPAAWMTPLRVTPLVWSFGRRPVVVLPSALFLRLSRSAQESVLIHELAHIRRRDYLVRFVEMIATTVFWWHPVVWLASSRLRELEEECCDQAVVDLVPGQTRTYASTLVDTLEFLARRPMQSAPLATAIHSTSFLTKRIRMLQQRRASRLTVSSASIIAAVVIAPLSVAFVAQARETSGEKTAASGAARITGEVVNEQGKPIANALVRVSVPAENMRFVTDSSYETRSGEDGRFEVILEGLGVAATASVDAFAPGYRRLSDAPMSSLRTINLDVQPGETAEAFIVLSPGLYFKGVVVNEAGEPVPGVRIGANTNAYGIVDGKERIVSSGGVERTASREDGSFEIFNYTLEPRMRDGKPEKGRIGFGHDDYVPAHIDDVYALPVEERTKLRIVLPTGRRAAGQVVDAKGQPVANVMVEVLDNEGGRDKATLTNANGKFEFKGLMEQPAVFRAHAMALRQKVALPVDLSRDQEDLELRLVSIPITEEPKAVEVLGMQLTDITPELKTRYDLHHDGGALILDVGNDSGRLAIGELREGYVFWLVGEKPIGSVREFVESLVDEAEKQTAAERRVRVVYSFRDLQMVGTNTQYMKVTEEDLRQLREVQKGLEE